MLLVALAFRALIPVGFMPSAHQPLTLEICRAGFLSYLETTAPAPQHLPGSSDSGYCPYGTAPAAGLIPHLPVLLPSWTAASVAVIAFEPGRTEFRWHRSHPARGPPSLS